MASIYFAVKEEFFNAILKGSKTEEYRLVNEYWRKRIEGRSFSEVVITLGYPPGWATERILRFPWRGYKIKTITHPHFGPDPVEVFAIKLTEEKQ